MLAMFTSTTAGGRTTKADKAVLRAAWMMGLLLGAKASAEANKEIIKAMEMMILLMMMVIYLLFVFVLQAVKILAAAAIMDR
jgi:hypothetical protein